jgi:hypothetical protein
VAAHRGAAEAAEAAVAQHRGAVHERDAELRRERARVAELEAYYKVEPDRYRLPSRPPHCRPSFLELLNRIT